MPEHERGGAWGEVRGSVHAVPTPLSMHVALTPRILYFGTPVVLISTRNPDGTANLAPMSSAWWLDQTCVLGLSTRSRTLENLRRERECVLNLPSADLVGHVDRLALTTGSDPVPVYKEAMGFEHVPDKFERAGLTALASEVVAPPRVTECPVHLEGTVVAIRDVGRPEDCVASIEVQVVRVHLDERILHPNRRHHVDPDRWRPLLMSFCEFYGLGERVSPSRLAEVF